MGTGQTDLRVCRQKKIPKSTWGSHNGPSSQGNEDSGCLKRKKKDCDSPEDETSLEDDGTREYERIETEVKRNEHNRRRESSSPLEG